MPERRRIAIVMSRLRRLVDPQAIWLGGLRAALRRIRNSGDELIVVSGTAGADFVQQGAQRLQIPTDERRVPMDSSGGSAQQDDAIPVRDRILVTVPDLVLALEVRINGHIHRALQQRLAEGGAVELIDLPDLCPRTVRDDLLGRGAVLWSPPPETQAPFTRRDDRPFERAAVCELVPLPASEHWAFLTHTTRACAGPWPGQTSTEYIDAVLDNSADADHSPLAALERIVVQRKVLAASRMIRGGHPVVCLTEVPLANLPRLRKFQSHRTRWDFEPYGICINKQWLQERGARPAVYGGEPLWHTLSECDRPFFQFTANPESTGGRDWTVEREWRHLGDLDLTSLPKEEGLIFVPRYEDAVRLSGCSPWPITLWPAADEAAS